MTEERKRGEEPEGKKNRKKQEKEKEKEKERRVREEERRRRREEVRKELEMDYSEIRIPEEDDMRGVEEDENKGAAEEEKGEEDKDEEDKGEEEKNNESGIVMNGYFYITISAIYLCIHLLVKVHLKIKLEREILNFSYLIVIEIPHRFIQYPFLSLIIKSITIHTTD